MKTARNVLRKVLARLSSDKKGAMEAIEIKAKNWVGHSSFDHWTEREVLYP